MSHPDPLPAAGAPPTAAALEALPADVWAALLPHLRAALQDVPDPEVTPELARLRDAATGRLAGGRTRRELCTLLGAGGPVWRHVHARLAALPDLPAPVRDLLEGSDDDRPTAAHADTATPPEDDTLTPAAADTPSNRLRSRARELREERDRWRRRAEGAEARADALEREVAALEGQLEAAGAELETLRRELEDAAEQRRSAVDRERRRREGELASLREELSGLRREVEKRRSSRRRRDEEQARPPERDVARSRPEPAPRVVPGRPSRLPEGVAPGTTEAVSLLLHPGRLVFVDGYNLTRQHRADLDLDMQRAWLVRLLANLAARRQVRPVVVFDGTRASGGRPPAGGREVEVRFTPAGITADDEVVLAVEGTDEPVLVVTDDRELAARVAASGADVAGTQSFLWAAT